jgi:hypothetical protein
VAPLLGAACSGVAPSVAPLDDQVVAVGGELRLELSASTPDGSRVSWSYTASMPNVRDRAQLSERPDGTGVFILRPLATEVGTWAFSFTASDGALADTLTINIEVRSAVGDASLPRFMSPLGPGAMLDLAKQACAEIPVVIDDADSTEVRIDLEEPRLAGATFVSRDRKSARLRFCPDDSQKRADDRFLLRISADDGDNPKQVIDFTVVLKKPPGSSCPGTPPVITHTPWDDTTLLAVEIVAEVKDDVGLKRPPLVYYGDADPGSSPDLARLSQEGKLRQAEMVLVSGTAQRAHYRGILLNPVADQPVGSSALLYYVIAASDNDDATGDCAHFVQSQVFQMRVTNPGGQGELGVCEPCTHDIQCGGAADSCVKIGSSGEGHCTRACSGAAGECPSGYECSAEVVRSVNDVKSRQCVPVAGTCNAAIGTCADDAREENDTREQALAQPPLSVGTHDNLVSCPSYGSFADEDWYRIELSADSKVELSLVGTRASDIDLDLLAADGLLVATSRGPESEEGIVRTLAAGTYFVRAKAQPILGKSRVERNPYRLTFQTGQACIDDPYEENGGDDDIANARPQPILWGFPSRDNMICAGDDDVFKVQLREGENLVVDLLFTQTKPTEDLNLHFLDAQGNDLTPCSEAQPQTCSPFAGQSTDSNEHFEYLVTAEDNCSPLCTFYIVVRGWNGSENRYDIIIDVED